MFGSTSCKKRTVLILLQGSGYFFCPSDENARYGLLGLGNLVPECHKKLRTKATHIQINAQKEKNSEFSRKKMRK
jgi:hypothetical protein